MYAGNMETSYLMIPRNKAVVKQMIELQFSNKDFLNEIKIFRKKWNIKVFSEETLKKYVKLIEGPTSKGGRFHVNIYHVLRNFNLNDEWYPILLNYITKNSFASSSDPECIVFQTETMFFKPINFTKIDYYLKVHPTTTKNDLLGAWSKVQKIIKGNKKLKPIENFDRNMYIFDLKSQGKKSDEIRKIIGENYSEFIEDSEITNIYSKIKKKITKK